VALFAAVVWLTLGIVAVTRKGASLRMRLASIALGLIVPLSLLGFRYGPKLARWAKSSSFHEADLSWQPPSNSSRPISGYHVYRAKVGSSSFEQLNLSLVSETKFVDRTVEGGSTYDYFIKSVDATTGVESGPSNTTRVKVPWMPNLAALMGAENH
jgi:hypothetical protein